MSHFRKHKAGKNQLNLNSANAAGEKKWYVFYLRPRTENKVCRTLAKLGYEVFFPVVSTIRIWKNRQKRKIQLPLFPNYLFVYTHEHELYHIKHLPHVVHYVASGGKPSTISGNEIEGIRRVLGLDCPVSVERKFFKGEHVRIVTGPLAGYEGILVKQLSQTKFGIELKATNHTILIDTALFQLEKL